MTKPSLFGPKPSRCSAPFTHCGACTVYPCIIGQPATSPTPPPEPAAQPLGWITSTPKPRRKPRR